MNPGLFGVFLAASVFIYTMYKNNETISMSRAIVFSDAISKDSV